MVEHPMVRLAKALLYTAAAALSLLVLIGAVAMLLLGSAAVTAAVIRAVLPSPKSDSAYIKVVEWAQSFRQPTWKDEEDAARNENLGIRDWSIECKVITIDNKGELTGQDPLYGKIRAIGNPVFYQRVEMARAIDEHFTVLEIATIAIIVIGLATTVFAGLRGEDSAMGEWKRAVHVLAVVFPALGTAVAAAAAFYAPKEQLIRASQALTSLQQLHVDVRTQLARLPCPSDEEKTHQITYLLGSWEQKLAQQGRETAASRRAATATGRTAGDSGLKPISEAPREVQRPKPP
jgi:hypothetical protein